MWEAALPHWLVILNSFQDLLEERAARDTRRC
jgi:hypothetical protein